MANNWQLGMIAGLDQNQSRAKINSQIDKLKGQLKDVSLTAKIDTKKISDIQNQLINLQVNLTNVKISDKALNDMVSQINNALKGIQIPNINIVGNGNQQFVNNITNGFKQSANAIESFKNSLSNAGKSSSEIDNIVKRVQSLNVQIDSLRFSESTNGLMNVNVAGLDEFGNKVKITQTLLQDLQTMQWNVSNTTTSVVSTKELERINNTFTDYTAKLAQFKSTNTNILSGLTQPLADFESKLAGLKNGTVSIDEVKNAYKLLGTEASKITENFTGQLSKTDAAIRKLAQGDEIMDKLKASFKGLNNAPKEITKELNSVSKLLQNVKNIESKEGRTANWSEAYRKWANEVDKLQAKLSVLQKQQANMTTPQIFNTSELRDAGVAYMTKVSNTINKQMPELQKMLNAHNWNLTDIKGIEDTDGKIKSLTLTVRDAEGALKQFVMQRAKLDTGKNTPNGLMQVGDVKILETASQAQEKLAQSTEKANAKLAEQANEIQLSWQTEGYKSKVDSLIARTNQWVDANGNARISTESLQTALNNLGTAYTNLNSSGGNTVANQQALIAAEEALDTEVKKVQSSITSMNSTMAKSSAVDSLRQKVQMFYDTNTATHRRWGTDLRSIMSQLASGTEVPIAKMKELERQFITIQNSARQAGKLGLSFFDTIKQGMSKFSYWTSSTFIIMKTVQSIKQMISNVKELNDALTNIKYTMNVTDSQLEKIGYSSLQMAKDLHSSAKNVLDAVKLYANAKESVDSILTKAQASIMMSNVTGFSGETSAKYLQTIMNQFNYTQDDLMMISDTIQTVSQNIAHDFADGIVQINDAISDSGEVARAAGMDLAEYSSIIGVLVENTGLQGSQLGNAMKSIITRTTKAGKILGIDEGDISNAEKALRDIGMEVRKSDGEFKDFDDTMAELADRWDDLSQVEQSEISFQLAGTRQTSILKTLLKNWDEVVEITEKANNSSGTTLENQNTYAESLTGKLTELSATWEKIGAETLDSSFLKGLTDIGITVSNLIEKFGLLNTVIVTSIGATGITKFVKSFA